MKRKIIKELEAMGIRYAEKPGVGMVKLNHLKSPFLINLLAKSQERIEKINANQILQTAQKNQTVQTSKISLADSLDFF